MNEQELLSKLASVSRMPDLDEMRIDVVRAMSADGKQETFERVQKAFIKAKNRLVRIPLKERDW